MWPSRKAWESGHDQAWNGFGPQTIPEVGSDIKDYATDEELEAVRMSLKKLRGHLNQNGTKIERQTIYQVCEALKEGRFQVPAPGTLLISNQSSTRCRHCCWTS